MGTVVAEEVLHVKELLDPRHELLTVARILAGSQVPTDSIAVGHERANVDAVAVKLSVELHERVLLE